MLFHVCVFGHLLSTLRRLREEDTTTPSWTFPLQRSGDTWHTALRGLPRSGVRYAYQVAGQGGWETGDRWYPDTLLLDPYAPLVTGRDVFADKSKPPGPGRFMGTFDFASPAFDWQGVQSPGHSEADLIIYEMGVRHFSGDPSSGVGAAKQGTYLGIVDKIPHLVELGVTAVELLPVHEFDELEFQRLAGNARAHMVNTWGYSTIAFFAPMSRYGTPGAGPAQAAVEFKTMVRELHRAGIEVILDVVYNHTAEGDDTDPYVLSMRGIDNKEYYIVDTQQFHQIRNFSGCGNTLSCNGPIGRQLVLDSLRHWVTEYHIDGFRFDLASAMTRRHGDGAPMEAPPVIRDISKDPVLSKCKLIAEPWDCGGLYQVGSCPNWDRWAEWNGKWRDCVRRFVRGDPGQKKELATRMAGSADMYAVNQRKPYHSINFVTAHDGFSLADLVSYNAKHNEANGEQGRDGTNDNVSWNCGVEGPTNDAAVLDMRGRQMRNFTLALMLSQGTPMMVMGDEYGHTKGGNNNTYGLDGAINNFQWAALEQRRGDLFRFTAAAIHFRRSSSVLGSNTFLTPADVTWHEQHWDDMDSRFLAWTLNARASDGPAGEGSLYVAMNMHPFQLVDVPLPTPPAGCEWHRVADTSLPSPRDFDDTAAKAVGATYTIAGHATLLLRASRPAAKL